MSEVEVEVALEQFAGCGTGRPPPSFVLGDEALTLVDERLKDASHEVFARAEVVVERGFGDSQPSRDVLQAGALDALLREEVAGDVLDALPGL